MKNFFFILTLFTFVSCQTLANWGFCNWSSGSRVFELENELARLGRHAGDPILRTQNLNTIRQAGNSTPRSDLPTVVVGGTGNKISPSRHISSENISDLFRENLDGPLKGHQGAKGLAVTDSDGSIKVMFWPTADKGGLANQVHHRDVAAAVLLKRADNLADEAADLAKTDRSRANFLTSESEKVHDHADKVGGFGAPRTHEGISYSVLEEMQGFKFSTEMRGKQMMITRFEVDSAITGAQLNRGAEINVEQLARQITAIQQSISAEVVGYRTIHIKKGLYEKLGDQIPTLRRLLRSNGINMAIVPL